jgi:hypothetical protein
MSKTKNRQAQRSKTEPIEIVDLEVVEGLSVKVMPYKEHEFLMTVSEVAKGYKASKQAILKSLRDHGDELTEGKHFIRGVNILLPPPDEGVHILYTPPETGVSISHTTNNGGFIQPHSILLTKRGIVRLGFFIKSENAKIFRDWAEDLVMDKLYPKSPCDTEGKINLYEMMRKMGIDLEKKSSESHKEEKPYSRLEELIDRASCVLGSQNRLAARAGVSAAIFSHVRNRPYLVSDVMKRKIEMLCQMIISEGANYVPDVSGMSTNVRFDGDLILEICKIEDSELRISIMEKITHNL